MELKWYAVKTFTGYEHKVSEKLEKKIERESLEDYISDIYISTTKRFVFIRGKLKLREEMIYPGYIFIKMNLTSEIMYTVRGVQYVTGYSGKNENKKIPDSIPEEEMNVMKKQAEEVLIELSPGDIVTYVDGFDKKEAKIVEINLDKEEMMVEVEATQVNASFEKIEKYKG